MKHLFVAVMAMMVSVAAFGQEVRNPSFTRGFAGNVEAGVLFKDGFAGEYVNQKFHSLSDVNSFLVPTFIQLRYSFLNKTVSPFIDLKGGLISDYSSSMKDMPRGFPDSGCGHFFRVGIGVDYKRYSFYVGDDWSQISYSDSALSNYAWVFGIGYRF